MPLTVPEIYKLLKEPPSGVKPFLHDAITHQERLRLHYEPSLNQRSTSSVLTAILNKQEEDLNASKFEAFKRNLTFPLSTLKITSKISKAHFKMFDGVNPVYKAEFRNSSHSQDWEFHRNEELNLSEFWKTKGFSTLNTSINSIMIVDAPSEQSGELPDPYLYFIEIGDIEHCDFKEVNGKKDVFDWIIFKDGRGSFVVICDGWYRVFKLDEGGRLDFNSISSLEASLTLEERHDLNYCPARFFGTSSISERNQIVKTHPVTNYLGSLDRFLEYDTQNQHLNLYARYPWYWSYATGCDYQHTDTKDESNSLKCHKGHLRNTVGDYVFAGSELMRCPVCSSKEFNGAGTNMEIEPPDAMNEEKEVKAPFGLLSIDRESLDYNNEDLEARKNEIFNDVTGYQAAPINNKAVNPFQIAAMFDTQEAALLEPQSTLEQAMHWAESTICKIRYGSSFMNLSLSLGTQHFLASAQELSAIYAEALKANTSMSILDRLQDRLFYTEFKNDQEGLQRQRVLTSLEPLRHRTATEALAMYQGHILSFEEYYLKVNFSSMIARFERENSNILNFGSFLDFDAKIKKIQEVLNKYAAEVKPEQPKLNEDDSFNKNFNNKNK